MEKAESLWKSPAGEKKKTSVPVQRAGTKVTLMEYFRPDSNHPVRASDSSIPGSGHRFPGSVPGPPAGLSGFFRRRG